MYFWKNINQPVWNNELSYEKRKELWLKCNLYIPAIKDIKHINLENLDKYLKIWNDIVFEEVLNNKLYSQKWLKYYLVGEYITNKVCIFDNHNLAFYFIWKYFLETWKKLDLIHIDQHSDMKEPYFIPQKLNLLEEIEEYTFTWLNVWNYLIPLQKLWFVNNIKQCRTEYTLMNLTEKEVKNKILNIDLDFWADRMNSGSESLQKVKKLIKKSSLVLIATSPYFMDQKKALELIYELFN